MESGNTRLNTVFAIGGAILACVLLYFCVLFISKSNNVFVPDDFVNTRREAVFVSQKIVDLTQKTNDKISEVNVLNINGGDTEKIISLIQEARSTNNEAYQSAVDLAEKLRLLTESMKNIDSEESQRIAYDAVATELNLVSEFISYTQKLNEFLDNLAAVITIESQESKIRIQNNLRDVNEKTAVINNLNKQFLQKMDEFDTSIK